MIGFLAYLFLLISSTFVFGGDFFFFQAEDGIRDRSPSRGLGDVYKRQGLIMGRYRMMGMRGDCIQATGVNSYIEKLLHLSGVYKFVEICGEV